MRIASWNVNSLRSRTEQLLEWLVERRIDVALLQETRCGDEHFPFDAVEGLGYEVAHHGVDHWNGVAVISRVGLHKVQRGFRTCPEFDEPRAIAATCGGVRCWSVYVPNGRALDDPHFGYKLKWLDRLAAELAAERAASSAALVAGDFNVRLGQKQDQKGTRGKRGGEKSNSGKLADTLIRQIDGADAIIIHGRACHWNFTFYPDRKTKKNADHPDRSVIDYMMLAEPKYDSVLKAGILVPLTIDTDHKAPYVVIPDVLQQKKTSKSTRRKTAKKVAGLPYKRAAVR